MSIAPRPWSTLLPLVVTCALIARGALAQPPRTDLPKLTRPEQQCKAAAASPKLCQSAIPACEQLAEALQKEPPSAKQEAALDEVWSELAMCETRYDRHAAAERHYRLSLAYRQKLYGPEHREVAAVLHSLAEALVRRGKYGEAETVTQQALAMLRKLVGTEHSAVARSLEVLALLLMVQDKYAESETLHRQALAMQRKLLEPEHLDIASSLHNLAILFLVTGKYPEAETLLRQALAIHRKLLDSEHPDLADCLNNLAIVISELGKYAEAESLYRQVLEMQRQRLGSEHRDIARSLSNVAVALHEQGRYTEAEALHRETLAMRRKLLGPEHFKIAHTLSQLGVTLSAQGRHAEAEPLHRQALEMQRKRGDPESVEIAHMLSSLGATLCLQGKCAEAEPLHRQALEMQRKRLGSEHPDIAVILDNLGSDFISQGQLLAAVPVLSEAARIREAQLRATVSETRMKALLDSQRHEEERVYSLLLDPSVDPTARKLALTVGLLRKGRAAEAGAAANLLLHRNLTDPAVQPLFAQWAKIRQQHEGLVYGGRGSLSLQLYQEQLAKLRLESESLEALLAAALPQLRNLLLPDFDSVVAAVARRLPKQGVLVEVVWIKHWHSQTTGAQPRVDAPHLIAMLLFPDQRIVSVDLGPAAEVDARSRLLLEKLQSPSSEPTAAAQGLYQDVFAPLLPHLAGQTDLYLSLDGTLNLIPFDALHDGADYLLGRYRFHYLTSGRDLLRGPAEAASNPAVLLANPDFGTVEPQAAKGTKTLYQRMRDLQALPGTQREVLELQALVGVQPLLAKAATEQAVRAARSPFILHIATHGLFLRDVDLPAATADDRERSSSAGSLVERSKNVAAPKAEQLPGATDAMNRSALVLAGVRQGQRAQNTAEDGLLTAEEARSLDLHGTKLVTLSACETGQGVLSAGQGVYGLRRAFLVAGAETLVTSLWRVHDEATGELMTMYYRKLFDKKNPGDRRGALVDAMTELRRRPDGTRAHPYYWAPFLVIGQDGPLRAQVVPQPARNP